MSGDLHFRLPGRPQRAVESEASELFQRRSQPAPVSGGAVREAELLAAVDQTPALSSVVNQILSVAGSQSSSAADLESLVSRDMVITGRLLKLVNSPFYALRNEVRSIGQAVTIVGMNSLRSLVVAASVSSLLMTDLSPYGFEPEGLWQHSIATAALARCIVFEASTDKDAAEDCFIGALLRDVGMLVLASFLARCAIDLTLGMEGVDDPILAAERQHLGYDHVWVGQRLAERWHLPAAVTGLLAAKGQRAQDVPPDLAWRAAILVLADRLANNHNIGLVPHHAFPRNINSRMIKAAGLDADGFKDVVMHVTDVVAAAQMDIT